MAIKTIEKRRKLQRRRLRSKHKMVGTLQKPRLLVNKSSRHVYAQLVDDISGKTITGVSDLNPELKGKIGDKDKKRDVAFKVGFAVAEIAKQKGIEKVIFDRGGYRYHGRVKSLAEGARKGGLQF
ncbi:MAG: 50S ribosomal protein L18 [candidate division Zixibacteria bacterium CG_4_9_14_3_um_filter_46_8]|nr:MAG: 50S ribosomal protein L18 [candidate division Zixibacteria bacterium CG_4_9_14_3_um_filter_46_8]